MMKHLVSLRFISRYINIRRANAQGGKTMVNYYCPKVTLFWTLVRKEADEGTLRLLEKIGRFIFYITKEGSVQEKLNELFSSSYAFDLLSEILKLKGTSDGNVLVVMYKNGIGGQSTSGIKEILRKFPDSSLLMYPGFCVVLAKTKNNVIAYVWDLNNTSNE